MDILIDLLFMIGRPIIFSGSVSIVVLSCDQSPIGIQTNITPVGVVANDFFSLLFISRTVYKLDQVFRSSAN
jgi:hypothetical protein